MKTNLNEKQELFRKNYLDPKCQKLLRAMESKICILAKLWKDNYRFAQKSPADFGIVLYCFQQRFCVNLFDLEMAHFILTPQLFLS